MIMTTKYYDTRPGREGVEIGSVPSTVEGSSGSGEERFGDRPQSLAEAAGAAADAKAAADVAGLARAAERQDRDTARRKVK
jgi:hypothetical protein